MKKESIKQFLEVLAELKAPVAPEDATSVANTGMKTSLPKMPITKPDQPDHADIQKHKPTSIEKPAYQTPEDFTVDDELYDPNDPTTITYIRIATMFVDHPANPSVAKMQVGIRRLLDNKHLTIEYRNLLNEMFRQVLEVLMHDYPTYQHTRDGLRKAHRRSARK